MCVSHKCRWILILMKILFALTVKLDENLRDVVLEKMQQMAQNKTDSWKHDHSASTDRVTKELKTQVSTRKQNSFTSQQACSHESPRRVANKEGVLNECRNPSATWSKLEGYSRRRVPKFARITANPWMCGKLEVHYGSSFQYR